MELTQLEYFRTIARYESITKAAEKLYLTQSSLSKTLSRLEKELGCTLFNRSNGRLYLNDNGRLFLDTVNEMFDSLHAGVLRLQQPRPTAGTVSISVNGFGEFVNQLEQFCLLHPEIHVNHSALEPKQILDALHNDSIDFAISSLPVEDELVMSQPFFSQPILFVCSKSHSLANKDPLYLTDIQGESFVINKLTGGRAIIDEIYDSYRIRLNTVMEGVSDELCLALTRQNYGVTLMPCGVLLNYFRGGYKEFLAARQIADCPVQMFVHFIFRRDRNLTAPAQALFDFLMDCMSHHQAALARAVAGRHWEVDESEFDVAPSPPVEMLLF